MEKNMYTLLLVSMIGFTGYAQKTTFGFKASFTSNHVRFYDEQTKLRNELHKPGFNAGGIANIQLSPHAALQPNLLIALRGGKTGNFKIDTWHFELPVNLLYTHSGFFIGGGPDLSYGFDGRAIGDVQPDGNVDIYSGEGSYIGIQLKRFAIAANATMGYTFPNGILISANFTHGLNNLNDGEDAYKMQIHSKSLGFSMAYMFNQKKR